jgi:hypothetical protein
MKYLSKNLPWIVPVLIPIIMGLVQVYNLVERVDKLEKNSATKGNAAILKLQQVDNRVQRLEEFCCGEIKGFDHYIEDTYYEKDE